MLLRALRARKLDSTHDIFARVRRERDELPAQSLQREAVFVFTAMRIWSERGNRNAVRALDCLCVPLSRTAVGFRRHPAFNVPAIVWKIFRDFAQLGNFAGRVPVRVVVAPFAADPRQARPSPHRPEVRLAEAVQPACPRQAQFKRRRRIMRFTKDLNAAGWQCQFTWQCLYSVIYRRPSGVFRRVLPVRVLDTFDKR